jgi:hypothetical protein
VMGARRLWLMAPMSLCAFLCVLVLGGGSAFAASSNPFGEQGHGAGQLSFPMGLGLDQETGDLYVSEFFNQRVSTFEGSGGFRFAWGWEVDRESPANALQTCTTATGCREGTQGPGSGEFASVCGAQAVAVDNDPLSSYHHDVYVVDFCNRRVEKFDPSGKFLLMFGGHVNETQDSNPSATEAQRDVCVAGEACTQGTAGTGNGEFEWAYKTGSNMVIGPEARVYVGDENRVEVFEPTGVWRENIPLPAALTSGTGKVTAIAVDAAGDMFVTVEGVPGVHELGPTGIELAVKFDESSGAVEALTLDTSSGNLFVADGTGSFHVLEYGPAGTELASFGSKTAPATKGIVYSEASHELYVANYLEDNIWRVAVPPPGPLVEPGSEVATPGLRGAASLQATIDPEGNNTSYRFEYVDDAKFMASGFAGASSTPVTGVGGSTEDFEEHQVEAVLPAGTLVAGTTYHWRVVASDAAAHTTFGASESFEEIPAARIEGPWAVDVASTSATVAARVDPLSSNTTYRLEVMGPGYEHVFTGNVGEGIGYVNVGPFHIQNLESQATYTYKLTTTSDIGTIESVRSFTTQPGGSGFALADGRAWELVSPAYKKGALISARPGPFVGLVQAAADGSGVVYPSSDVIGEGAVGKVNVTTSLSVRGPGGWRTMDLTRPTGLPEGGQELVHEEADFNIRVSSNLGLLTDEQSANPAAPLSREASERTPYLRHNFTCIPQPEACYTPLVTAANVEPPGTHFGGVGNLPSTGLQVVGGTPDLSHVFLESPYSLKEGAVVSKDTSKDKNLYEWSAGGLRLVNVWPDGSSRPGPIDLGYQSSGSWHVSAHSVSDDGRWVVWSTGAYGLNGGDYELFVRDMVAGKTLKVGGSGAEFQALSSDGKRLFYREHGELYVLDPETGVVTGLTSGHGAGEANAGVQDAVLGASEDGSYVYFVAKGVLASGAKDGGYNLYVAHAGVSGWMTTFVATLSGEDEKSWFTPSAILGNGDRLTVERDEVTSQVSGNGRFVSFMSSLPLTGYDNADAVSGHPDEEVFVYDAVANRVTCASCNPTGARPLGVFDGPTARLQVDPGEAWGGPRSYDGAHWLAAITPSWFAPLQPVGGTSTESYQPRFLSDTGRVFFDSSDGLVPQATNGVMNVYEFEPVGVGDCTVANVTFSTRSDGCVNLLSAGTSDSESVFFDASESGDDAFFITTSKLVGKDFDTAYDVYDAHVCSASAPCVQEPVVPPPCTSGDSCKAAPAPQPEIFGATPSATFSGVGNVTPASSGTVVKSRSLSSAQRLARALRACHKKKGKGRQRMCERQAHRRYANGRGASAKNGRGK